MMGRLKSDQGQLFYKFHLGEAIPEDHLVRKIDTALDLSWVRGELAAHYSSMGRPSIDPELMIRMLILGYVFAIRSERALCREVQLNLAYRWFCGLGIEDKIPVRMNGRDVLACWEAVEPAMRIEPLRNLPVVRDLIVDDPKTPLNSLEPGGHVAGPDAYPGFPERFHRAYVNEMNLFTQVIAGEVANPSPARESLISLRLAEACEQSRRTGAPVKIKGN